jgi:zinc transport system substrate-binding protein
MGRLFTLTILTLLLCGCTERARNSTNARNKSADNPLIVCTIKPLELIVREVVGEHAEVRTLLPPGADAHDYEPTPSDIEAVSTAALFVMVGGHLDHWAEVLPARRKVEALDYVGSSTFPIDYKRDPGASDARAADMQTSSDGSVNPHFWLNPISALGVTPGLIEALPQALPRNEKQFHDNFEGLLEQFTQLDHYAASQLQSFAGASVVQSHESLNYLLRGFDIQTVGVIEAHSGVEPSAKRMSELIAAAKQHKAKCVIVDAGHSDKAAKIIAAECGIPIVRMDPEAVSTEREYGSYEEWFKYNVNQLAKGLQ